MNARPKKKLCWNCEGEVSLSVETCPYCGVSVIGLSLDISPEAPIPPYRLVNPAQESSIHPSPYEAEEEGDVEPIQEQASENIQSAKPDDSTSVITTIALLFVGSIFFIFGFALLLFSDEGYLSLHWNAAYWFIYLTVSCLLLALGFRKLNSLPDQL